MLHKEGNQSDFATWNFQKSWHSFSTSLQPKWQFEDCKIMFLASKFEFTARPWLDIFQRKIFSLSWILEDQMEFHQGSWTEESWLSKWIVNLTLNLPVLFPNHTRESFDLEFDQKIFLMLEIVVALKRSFKQGRFQLLSRRRRLLAIPDSGCMSKDLVIRRKFGLVESRRLPKNWWCLFFLLYNRAFLPRGSESGEFWSKGGRRKNFFFCSLERKSVSSIYFLELWPTGGSGRRLKTRQVYR